MFLNHKAPFFNFEFPFQSGLNIPISCHIILQNKKILGTSSSPTESYRSLDQDLPRYGFQIIIGTVKVRLGMGRSIY